ncbi:MAG: hypothetical protein SPF41_00075 [Candidatus Merdousia sp.]|nr:hypothetical protein [Candidatus Merdousia sp.]
MPTTKKSATKTAKTREPAKKAAVKKVAAKTRKTASCPKKCETKAKLTRVIAKFDAGWGNQLYIRGLGGSLDWQKGVPMQSISDDEWLWEQIVPQGTVSFKVLLNDKNWSAGEDLVVAAGDTVICRPTFL